MNEVIVKIVTWGVIAGVLSWILFKDLIQDFQTIKQDPKKFWRTFWKNWGEPLLIAGIFALLIRTFLFAPYKIPTGSMIPTLLVGDKIFVDKISYRFDLPMRGDIVVFKYPIDPKKDFVKRLIGMPGERVEIRGGVVLVNGKPLTEAPFSNNYYYNVDSPDWKYGHTGQVFEVPAHFYFVLGDNSANSSDSRNWGFVPQHNVLGRAKLIWWPPSRVKVLK
jgi:signal peptidase I